jgi:hypothetical protein
MEADEFLLVELMSWPLLLTLLEVNPTSSKPRKKKNLKNIH